VLLFQEFDLEIWDKVGREDVVIDHLSRLGLEATLIEEFPIGDSFPNDQLLVISHQAAPWYADLVNFKVCGVMPTRLSYQQRKRFLSNGKYYVWEKPLLYKLCGDGVHRSCLPEDEVPSVLHFCHASTYVGYFRPNKTVAMVLQVGFYWPTFFKDVRTFIVGCDRCQQSANISKRYEMPQSGILEVELFDIWGIDFMGPFPFSHNNLYILVAVDYVLSG